MRNVVVTSTALLVSLFVFGSAQAATDIQLNSGIYRSGPDLASGVKSELRITSDDSGRSLQIEAAHLPSTTLSLNDTHNFDTPTPLKVGVVSREFIRKCTAKPGQPKPCFKGLYDDVGKLRLQEGDEFNITARLSVLSSDSVLEMQWTTWTRDETMIAQQRKKEVLKWQAPAKNSAGSMLKDPTAL